jgi:hypothetical protein
MGFGLKIRFGELFDTMRDYTLKFTIRHTGTSSVAVAQLRLPLGSQTILGLSYRLLTATAHND